MDSDTPLVVNLEVTVPRLVLATEGQGSGQMDTTVKKPENDNEAAQIRILPIAFEREAVLTAERGQLEGSIAEVSERMLHAIRFRMFRGIVPVQDRPLLFQVLRWYKGQFGGRRRKRKTLEVDHGHLYVSDASVFSVEFRQRGEDGERTPAEAGFTSTSTAITPGVNRVVIYVGTPGSYSIDGAES